MTTGRLLLSIVSIFTLPLQAQAQCDAHFTFDGSLADTSGNGYDGHMIGKGGAPATPKFTEGKFGHALQLDGTSAMRVFLDLHFDSCPQVTIAAWIKTPAVLPKGTQELVSAGSGIGPGLRASGPHLVLRGPANGLIQRNVIRANAGWIFVAGVYDFAENTYALHWRNRSIEGKLREDHRTPEEAIWVGAFNDSLNAAVTGMAIDDLRIIGKALDKNGIRALQTREPAQNPAASPPPAAPQGAVSSGDLLSAAPSEVIPAGTEDIRNVPSAGIGVDDELLQDLEPQVPLSLEQPLGAAEVGSQQPLTGVGDQFQGEPRQIGDMERPSSPTDLLSGTAGSSEAGAEQQDAPSSATNDNAMSGFHDPASLAWQFRSNLTNNGYSTEWQKLKNEGYVPIDIEMDDYGNTRYRGVWQENVDDRKWASYRNLTDEQFSQRWQEYKDKGYRPIDQETAVMNGAVRYSLIMVENKSGLNWISNRNLTSAQFSEKFNANKGTYRPIDIDAVEINGAMRYSIIWVENKMNETWAELRDMSPATYGQKAQEYRSQGYRVADLECYRRSGSLNYAAIWEKNSPGRDWAALRGMSATALRNRWKRLRDQGFRVIDIEACPSSGGSVQYAAVWRENDARHDWAGRADAEQKLADFVDDNSAPGAAAAVISNGRVVFRAGRDMADAEKSIWAHSGSIYRTASIAKGITGVLGFDMQDDDSIDLDLTDRTDSIVSGLQGNHTHTVLDLLQNVGCIGDYNDSGLGGVNADQTQYASAQKVLTDKQNGLLASNTAVFGPCTPGTGPWKYSTHGYTIAAAAIEVEGGASFAALLKQRISDVLNLPTLRAETRSGPDSSGELVKLYEKDGNGGYRPVTSAEFQNDSWKWGGGGMRSSALDLARLGEALLRDRLFPRAVRDQMWTGTSAMNNYGAGWNVTFNSGSLVAVTKRGRQQAALAHIRIDVANSIVVVAMTNGTYTSDEGNAINTLTNDLLSLAQSNP